VAPVESQQSSRLLNDIASPNVMLREALLASSAFPGFYPPVTLAARDQNGERKTYLQGRKWMDGSVSDDLPIKRVMRLYGVNHTIVSQTNPVALPFVGEHQSSGVMGALTQTWKTTAKEWSLTTARILSHQTRFAKRLNHMVRLSSSVLAQTYTGDINILPPKRVHNPLQLLSQRGPEEIQALIRHGERAAWPKLEIVRLQTKISRTLDALIQALENELLRKARPKKSSTRKKIA
jgi:NTE family protein